MTKEQLNWRSIGMSETIIEKWNAGITPAYYLIDVDGIIRRKWIGNPGGEVLEKAIDKVLDESMEKEGTE